jgi:hypothetical protein
MWTNTNGVNRGHGNTVKFRQQYLTYEYMYIIYTLRVSICVTCMISSTDIMACTHDGVQVM